MSSNPLTADSSVIVPSSYMPHIDGLRAIAVLAVLINHFHNGLLPSGFLGVDIFFVISGYVVTSSLLEKRHTTWKEYLLGFYIRRFKRLVPALAVCVLFTSAFALLLVAPSKYVFQSGAFSLVGMSNLFFLKHATDYFATAAELNPFTHTWSLGVEEQFYFFFPMLLGFCGYCVGRSMNAKRNFILAVTAIGIPSFFGYLYLTVANPSAAFFLMPTRFWEFGAGCLLHVARSKTSSGRASIPFVESTLSLFVLGIVIGTLFLPKTYHHFSVPLIVAATSFLIWLMDKKTPATALLSLKPMVSIGLASYSLYLWHWPILSLSRYVSGINSNSIPVLILLTVVLSWASLRFIERPLRRMRWTLSEPKLFTVVLGGMFACFVFLAVVLPKISSQNSTILAKILRVPEPPRESYDFLGDCYKRDLATYSSRLNHCLTASRSYSTPHAFYLLGDSHAQKLAKMVSESIQGTPFEFRFLIADEDSDFPYAAGHWVEVSSNLEKVLSDSQAGDVVAMTFHRGHLNSERDVHIREKDDVGHNEKLEVMRGNMDSYIRRLTEKGVRIIFINDVPLLGSMTTVQTCMMQQIFFGSSSICRVSFDTDMRTRSRQDKLFVGFAKAYPGVSLWDPAPLMYKDSYFNAYDEQLRYLMIDWHHISQYQESLLVPHFMKFLVQEGITGKLGQD
jgi:peptidoglycan/LPS O-acetylase OafA/YrhL